MINQGVVCGVITKVNIVEPKDGKKPGSAIIMVRHGRTREASGGDVEFINANPVRIPSYKFAAVRDSLAVGAYVEVGYHLQGVIKGGYPLTEIVADNIKFLNLTDIEASLQA